jgi:hypothetical protein
MRCVYTIYMYEHYVRYVMYWWVIINYYVCTFVRMYILCLSACMFVRMYVHVRM